MVFSCSGKLVRFYVIYLVSLCAKIKNTFPRSYSRLGILEITGISYLPGYEPNIELLFLRVETGDLNKDGFERWSGGILTRINSKEHRGVGTEHFEQGWI